MKQVTYLNGLSFTPGRRAEREFLHRARFARIDHFCHSAEIKNNELVTFLQSLKNKAKAPPRNLLHYPWLQTPGRLPPAPGPAHTKQHAFSTLLRFLSVEQVEGNLSYGNCNR